MRNINVSQDNTVVKHIPDSLLEFVYNISKINLENTQYMKGRLEVVHGYQDAIDFLMDKFKDLYVVSTGDPYIRFTDSVVQAALANRIGDGIGVTTPQALAMTNQEILKTLFTYNTNITSFNELKFFTNITSLPHECFRACKNLESIDISNIDTFSGSDTFSNCNNLKYIIGLENLKEIYGKAHFYDCDLRGTADLSGIINDHEQVIYFDQNMNLDEIKLSPYITRAPRAYKSGVKRITNGSGVTVVTHESYVQSKSLESVDYPNLEEISGSSDFWGCSSLKSIYFPNLITISGSGHFSNCTALETANIGSNITILNNYLFSYCTSLKTLSCPNVTVLNEKCLMDTTSLESIDFDWSNITYFGYESLLNSKITNIDEVISFDSLTSLAAYALQNTYFKHVKFPVLESLVNLGLGSELDIEFNGLITSIPNSCFNNHKTVLTMTKLHNVTSIGSEAFRWAEKLQTLDFTNKLKTIGSYAFGGCRKLETFASETVYPTTIGNSAFDACDKFIGPIDLSQCVSIGDYAFQYCYSLTSIGTLNSSITSLGPSVFRRCYKLSSITGLGNVETIGVESFKESYESANQTGLQTTDFSSNLKTISRQAFYYDKLLTTFASEIVYPTTIGDSAFQDCTKFTGPIDLSQCTSLGSWVFYGCSSLTSVGSINSNITIIPESSFRRCYKLSSITGLGNVETINQEAFKESYDNINQTGLQTTDFSSNLKTISRHAFFYDKLLTTFATETVYPTTIGDSAFQDCTKFTGPIDLSQCTSLGSWVFYGCSSLTSIGTLNSTLTEIPSNCFRGCSGLTGNIDIPESVTKLNDSCFYGMTGLTSITFHSLTPPTRNGDTQFEESTYIIYVPASAVQTYIDAWGMSNRIQAKP